MITNKIYKDIKKCYKKQIEVVEELNKYFPSLNPTNQLRKHSADKSGNSEIKWMSFFLKSGDIVSTACFDWSTKMQYTDNFRTGLITSELNDWFKIAYN